MNLNHRAWFILPNGELYSGTTHRNILKKDFSINWNLIKENEENIEDCRIEEVLEHRLLKTGAIKIGEVNNQFYIDVQSLDKSEFDLLQSFVKSICDKATVDMLKCKITISIKELKKIIKYNDGFTLGDLMNNKLHDYILTYNLMIKD
jgi:hypothetical protein